MIKSSELVGSVIDEILHKKLVGLQNMQERNSFLYMQIEFVTCNQRLYVIYPFYEFFIREAAKSF